MFNTFATHKKLMTLIIVILAVILGILGYRAFGRIIYNVQAGKVSTDNTYCKEMAPIKVTLSNDTFNPKGRPEVTLDFKDKSVLADGKFGYWYELNLKNKTIITQAELSPVPKNYNKQQKAMLKIDKPGTFYVKVSDYDLGRDEDGDSYKLYLDRIRYSY